MYRNRKGFTIVELVIVIAVIAILAAVLIPTFSSLTQKANLSSDMQAVRQMNMALQNDEALNGKCTNVEQAMQVIANAGYDTDNDWSCLTDGYQVYWYKTANRCVLYNATTAKVEYPKDYETADLMADAANFFVYNQTYKNAISADMGFSSGSAVSTSGSANLSSGSSADQTIELGSQSVTVSKDVLGSLSSMGITATSSKLYGYSQSVTTSGTAKATVDKYAIYDASQSFTSDSQIKPNVYYISVTEGSNDTDTKEAQAAAGNAVYTIFAQMNANMVEKDANIVIAPGTELDVSGSEWQPAKLFKGYFGTTDATKPVTINGLALSNATSYVDTHTFTGSDSTYYLSGFFGAVTSDANTETVIENVTFKNINIVKPASDYNYSNTISNDSNCTGIIGGIVSTEINQVVNVTLRNIDVVDSSVYGQARVGGLVAYIGGFIRGDGSKVGISGRITIEGCDVECDVTTDKATGYGTCGGILGFVNKTYNDDNTTGLTINISNCSYTGALKGTYVGGIVGHYNPTSDVQVITLNVSSCTVTSTYVLNEFTNSCYGKYVGRCEDLRSNEIANFPTE